MNRQTYTKADFAWTKLTPLQIEKRIPQLIALKKEHYEVIRAVPKKDRTFENTILAFERSDYDIWDDINEIDFLMSVSPSKAIRDTVKKQIDALEKAFIDIEYDPRMYRAFKEYTEGRGKTDKLEDDSKILLEKMTRNYRRMGFELDAKSQAKFKANRKKLTTLGNEFSKNINDYEDHIAVKTTEVDGLSEHFLAGLTRDEAGNYLVSLAYPEYFPFLQNSTNEIKRRELIDKYNKKGGAKNMQLLTQLVTLRDENAKLLGYKNHGEFVTEIRMAKDPKTVMRFLDSLAAKVKRGFRKDIAELDAVKRDLLGSKEPITYYDHPSIQGSRLGEELKKRKYNFNERQVREYFPLEVVTAGMFKIYETLFGLKFELQPGFPTWHKDVSVYAVRDVKTKQILSYFFLDLHPREGKYGHAAAFGIKRGRVEKINGADGYVPPVRAMVTNFSKPSKNNPSLLSHAEVETYFHEFGHVIHDMLTEARYASQSGTRVARDFVEAPSQMLENWPWDAKMLRLMSGHYKDHSKKLPKALLDKMLAAKDHLISTHVMRQLVHSIYDMEIHTKKVPDLAKHYSDVSKKYLGFPLPKGALYPAGWGHMVGYDAGYYGYMWSLVYAADMFTRFAKEGLLNKKTGADYRHWILSKGSSMDEMAMVEKFLGRKSNNKAFLKELGL